MNLPKSQVIVIDMANGFIHLFKDLLVSSALKVVINIIQVKQFMLQFWDKEFKL